jgi:hypothetical protein
METAESPDSLMSRPPPPPPPGAEPVPDETFACTGRHFKSRGAPGERLITAIEAFLADGCRAHLPNVIPGLLFMREGSGRDCADGAGYRLRIETATHVEDYSVGCFVPGSSLEALMRALEGQRTPLDATLMRPQPAFTAPLSPSASHYQIDRACRDIAEECGYEIDYDDPFQW